MAVSLAEIIILGLLADWLFRQFRLPGLIGILLVGVVLGPHLLGALDPGLLAIGPDLRLIALIVILLRAGFELSRRTLHQVGMRALLLAFIPALAEGAAITLAGPRLLGLTTMESVILGSVLVAVSPAVVVPMMLRFNTRRLGAAKGIPTMIIAASSGEDVFAIVVASVLIGLHTEQPAQAGWKLAGIPVSIALGVLAGLGCGALLYRLFDRFNPRATKRVLVIIALAILLVRAERLLETWLPFTALAAAMAIGFVILETREPMAHEIAAKLAKIWVFAEIILFTLVGAQVNVPMVWKAGAGGAALIGIGLAARGMGTLLCLAGSSLTLPERLFVAASFFPKATVQAAIGAAPLLALRAAGLPTAPGELILAMAVLSIVLTAPAGALVIALLGERVLAVAPGSVRDAYEAARASEPQDDVV